jgi:hypothetical protein
LAFAISISCVSVCAGSAGLTTSALACVPISVIGVKSSCGSNPMSFRRAGLAARMPVLPISGCGMGDMLAGDIAAGALPALDHQRLTQSRCEQPANNAADHVARPARLVRDDLGDRPGRVVAPGSRSRAERQQQGT